jgi:Protein kinase domain
MRPLADAGRIIAGRYRLEAPIGRGAMGVVWRARDQLLDRDVAVKEVQIADTLTAEERANAFQRTLREAKTAARLNHPGVVTVYDVAEDGGRPWIIMQLVSAQSLDQVLATSGPLSPRRAAEMGRQLLAALNVAHAAGVMHRDVKPSNVLLGRDDRAVLTDFGIATFAGDTRLTQSGMVMGSPGFTAPERIRGEDATPASDLWSLGATLYAAVEGHGPYERHGGGAVTIMSAIINEDAPTSPKAGALAPVIAALLRREPADRPDAATAARMITEVLPQLPTRTGSAPAGYVPTAIGQTPAHPDRTALDRPVSAGQTIRRGPAAAAPASASAGAGPAGAAPAGAGPAGAGPADAAVPGAAADAAVLGAGAALAGSGLAGADTLGGGQQAPDTMPTAAQPDSGGPPQPEPTQAGWGQGGSAPGLAAGSAPPSGYGSAGAETPHDFSSWYGPPSRSGSAPSAQPRPGAAQPGGSWPDQPGRGRRRRRSGLWWKIGVAALVVIGGGAGASTIVLLRHSGTGSTPVQSTSSVPPATLAPPGTAPQIVDAINEVSTGPLPSGFTTYSQAPTGTEAAGFSLAAPDSWRPSTSGYQTYLTDPSANVNILIDLTPHTYPNDMLREAEYIKSQSLTRFPGYTQLGLARTVIRGRPGAYWKFTWLDNGVRQEAIDLLWVAVTPRGPQSYALYMTAPASVWNQTRPVFDEEVETFHQVP